MDASLDQENVGAAVKKVSKAKAVAGDKPARATKKATVKPLQSSSAFNVEASGVPPVRGSNGKTIEEMYQKKSQLEHILLRPDTYVGSVEKHTQMLWVYEEGRMVQRAVTYVPGLYKIFDEILVNAADNKQRDPSMDSVKVTIDVEENAISVFNNGDGVPVEIHQEEGVYVPEMIFGHLLTSSNYDDSEKKTTGGRNGYGAKLANIFSVEFTIETADGRRGKRYKQIFKSNMTEKSEPVISTCKGSENWTKVTFKPDLPKFNMTHLEGDVVALMSKRVVDIAGCLGKTVKVELNGQRLPIKAFGDYVNLYLTSAGGEEPPPRIYERVNDRWEVCVSLSDGQFQQVSFANSIATIKGGSHVQCVSDQIVAHVMAVVQKKNKNAGVKNFQIRNHLWVFVNALIDNPAFDSQTKETLTTRQGSFGSKCELSQKFLKDVTKSGVVENVLTWADFKQSKELKKSDGTKRQRLSGIAKLDDANDAGGRNSESCTLILTEGDSAKALAMAGISVVGRNSYGVFPLRGKLLNVREATHKQIMDNAEINNIKRILGLQHGKDYDSTKALRYGHLMIMTDQDHDGSHIKGLLINFIHTFWPSLLKVPSFLVEFITPIVKATHKNKRVLSFYTLPEYESWKESLRGETRGWTIKYYKGLGTSTAKEGKEYFRDLDRHKKEFEWRTDQDSDAIEMAFSKKKIEARKSWLRQYEPGTFLDPTVRSIKYSDFINKELILFSMADLSRSIPSMVDGLKPGQRKILFCSFKRKFFKQAKVAQFVGYVGEQSAYHHGEQSLSSTIVGMAQNYVGSNNINLLAPLGQFGTRNQGGKDAASPRYIFTCLAPLTRYLFPEADDILLNYLKEDGQSIEPSWYAPIIPMVLVNGSEGIGTGWSSFVPNYNPRDIVSNIKRLLQDEPMEPMEPWYKGFKGTVERSATKESGVSYLVTGVIEAVNDTTLKISELPVRKWTQDYKEYLESLMVGTEKIKEAFIQDYREHNTDTLVHFEVMLSAENMAQAIQEGLTKKFKLTTTISTSNMHLFNEEGIIQKYESPEHILEAFFKIRMKLYVDRKAVLLRNLQQELLKLANKVRFITGVVNGEIIVSNRKRADLLKELKRKEFTPFPRKAKTSEPAVAGAEAHDAEAHDAEGEAAAETEEVSRAGDYDYLLSMAIGTLTWEKVQELIQQQKSMEDDVEELRKSSPKEIWEKDLNKFIEQLDAQELEEAKEEEYESKHMAKEGAPAFKRKVVRKDAKSKKVDSKSETVADAAVKKASTAGTKAKTVATAPVAKRVIESDSEDEVPSLRARLSAYSKQAPAGIGPSTVREAAQPSRAEVTNLSEDVDDGTDAVDNVAPPILDGLQVNGADSEDESPVKVVAKRQGPGRSKKPAVGLSDSEDDFDPAEEVANKGRKKVGVKEVPISKPREAAAAAKAKPPAAAGGSKKRGKKAIVTDLTSDDEAVNVEEVPPKAPQLKMRKIRVSPFNKKSASVTKDMPKPAAKLVLDPEPQLQSVAESRPKRTTRAPVQVIDLDDSDDEDEVESNSEEEEFDTEED